MTQKQINSLCVFFVTGGKISLSLITLICEKHHSRAERATHLLPKSVCEDTELSGLPFSLSRIAQFSSACPIMSAQGRWALLCVRDAIALLCVCMLLLHHVTKVSAAPPASLSFHLPHSPSSCTVHSSDVSSGVNDGLKPYLPLHHLDSCTRKQESEKEKY